LDDSSLDIDANAADYEAALRETSRRLNAVLDNTRMAVFVMDERQHCVYANAAAEQLTGYSFPEMQGRPLHDVIHHTHPDGRHYPLEECPIDRAFPEDFQVEGEEIFVHKDGSFYPVAFTASPIRDEASNTVGTVIEVRGIAQEKAREAAMRESQERLRLVVENAKDHAIFVIDAQGTVTEWWPGARDVFGWEAEEIVGRSSSVLWTPEDVAGGEFENEIRTAMTEGCARDERWHVCKDGSRVFMNGSVRPLHDAEGRLTGLLKIARDETHRREDEAALRVSRETLKAERDRLYSLFEDAPGFFVALEGPDHVFVLANKAYRRLIGERDLIGKPVREAIPEVASQGYLELLDRVYATGEPFIGEALPVRLDRTPGAEPEERFIDFIYQPIHEADGTVSGIFAEGADVTERVLFMSQQKLLLDELNHRVKNNLATVQAIAQQTARHAPDLESFRKTFESRLVALARTHDVLTAEAWESADLKAVLLAELGPYGDNRTRVEGPPVALTPAQALSFGLVIHELATNAAKYGALSLEATGCVRVTWTVTDGDPRRAELVWRESDGPPVAEPEHRGFGSRLIERGVREMGGEVSKEWLADGLVCRMTIPL
jgi:PAS domain S-box-containing protein